MATTSSQAYSSRKYSDNINIAVLGDHQAGKSSLMGEYWFETTLQDARVRGKNRVRMIEMGLEDAGSGRGLLMNKVRAQIERGLTFAPNCQQLLVPPASSFLGAKEDRRTTNYTLPYNRAVSASSSSTETGQQQYSCSMFDLPGHRRYQRTTIRGVAMSDIAVVIVSAEKSEFTRTMSRKGETESSPFGMLVHHLLYCFTNGIKRLVVAVNKLDLFPTAQEKKEAYDTVTKQVKKLLTKMKFDLSLVEFVPTSALYGSDKREPDPPRRPFSGSDERNIITRAFEEDLGPGTKCFAEVLHEVCTAFLTERKAIAEREPALDEQIPRGVIWNVYKIGGIGTVACVKVISGVFRANLQKPSIGVLGGVQSCVTRTDKETKAFVEDALAVASAARLPKFKEEDYEPDNGEDNKGGKGKKKGKVTWPKERAKARRWYNPVVVPLRSRLGQIKFSADEGVGNFLSQGLVVKWMERWHCTVDQAIPGDFVGMTIKNVQVRDLAAGMVITGFPRNIEEKKFVAHPIPTSAEKRKIFSPVLRRDPKHPTRLLEFEGRRKSLRSEIESPVTSFRAKVLVLNRTNGLIAGEEMIARVGQQQFPCLVAEISDIVTPAAVARRKRAATPPPGELVDAQGNIIPPPVIKPRELIKIKQSGDVIVRNGQRAILTLIPMIGRRGWGYYYGPGDGDFGYPYGRGLDNPIIEQVNSPFVEKGTHPNLSRIIFTDGGTTTAIGLCVETNLDQEWGQEALFMNIICLRRVFPFELSHLIAQFATRAAVDPFR